MEADMTADKKDGLVHSLAAHYYTDSAVFRQESERLLARSWQFAGHISSLRKPGDYFTFEIAGESLFCIRDRKGELRGFYNVCQHRAHRLLEGAGSKKLIICPYHAWTYELDGKFRAGPNVKSVPGFDASAICLSPIKIENLHGFLFANLDPQAKSLDEWFPGVRDELADYVPDIGMLEPLQWYEIPENCNWKVSVENYSECYHCTLNHKTFATGVIKPETYNVQPAEAGYILRHTTECQSMEAMTYDIDTTRPHATEYRSLFLWPMFSFQIYPGNVLNTYHWRARAVDACTVWRGWYTPKGVENEAIRKLGKQDRETTVEEDIHLVESVQKGLQSRGYSPGPLVIDPACGLNSEHSIRKLHEWVREAVDGP